MYKKPLIVLFVGIPGSGKTTFAKKLAARINAVNLVSDSIRLWMWGSLEAKNAAHATPEARKANNKLTFGALDYATNQVVAAGQSVIYDCNANHPAERQEKYDVAAKHGALAVVVRLRVPYDVSLQRIQTREETHDARQFAGEKARQVLDQFTAEIEEPGSDEFVIEIDGEATFDAQFAVFDQAVRQKLEEGHDGKS